MTTSASAAVVGAPVVVVVVVVLTGATVGGGGGGVRLSSGVTRVVVLTMGAAVGAAGAGVKSSDKITAGFVGAPPSNDGSRRRAAAYADSVAARLESVAGSALNKCTLHTSRPTKEANNTTYTSPLAEQQPPHMATMGTRALQAQLSRETWRGKQERWGKQLRLTSVDTLPWAGRTADRNGTARQRAFQVS